MDYKIEHVQPDVYLDAGGKPVRGYLVRVSLTTWSEIHDIQVATLDPDKVKETVDALLANREALSRLGV